jgi:hypothetical protein
LALLAGFRQRQMREQAIRRGAVPVHRSLATRGFRYHPLATGALRPDHAPYVTPIRPAKCPSPPNAATLAPILRTEDLTVCVGGLTALNQVNFKASETKGPCPRRHRAADAVSGRGAARQGRGEP